MKTTLATVLTFLLAVTAVFAEQVVTEAAKLKAGDGAAGDLFAWKVALDGSTALISGVFDDDKGDNSGSAYVFVRQTDGSWSQQAKLKPNDGAPGDKFAFHLDIDGDTAIIGASLDDDRGPDSGSAYIFTRSGLSWSQQAKLTAPDGPIGDPSSSGGVPEDSSGSSSGGAAGDSSGSSSGGPAGDSPASDGPKFGLRVAISGDTAVAAAVYDDEIAKDAGKVYVFARNGTSWNLQKVLTPDPPASNSTQFGYSATVSGDTILVGAWRETGPAGDLQGSVYVFDRDQRGIDNWESSGKITASDGAKGDVFGSAVDIDGNTAVIGAIWDDEKGSESGSAYVFMREVHSAGPAGESPIWKQQAKLTPADGTAGDRFGVSVGIHEDQIVVGAMKDDGNDSGAVYLFTRSGSSWTEKSKFRPCDGGLDDGFGFHVALSDDTVLAGAFSDDDLGSQSGSAYVFEPASRLNGGRPWVDAALQTNLGHIYLFQGASYFRMEEKSGALNVLPTYPKNLPGGWMGLPQSFIERGIDAALHRRDNGKYYFFSGNEYVRLIGVTVESSYPVELPGGWSGLPQSFRNGIDAATYHNGHSYLFKGRQYVRYTGATLDDGYPKELPGGWGLTGNFTACLDAAITMTWASGAINNYFFKNERYTRLTNTTQNENYPQHLPGGWEGLQVP
ncbi:MAG: hypothetical protein GY722_26515 [bacterium]|nr:hypothetical protein [bacterium]